MSRPIGNSNEIQQYLHCALCLESKPSDVSPAEYQQIQVGWTPQGLQVWCRRHDVNMLHMDFEGERHPANITRKLDTQN